MVQRSRLAEIKPRQQPSDRLGHRSSALARLAGAGAPFVIFARASWKLTETIAVYRTAFGESRFSGKTGKPSASDWRTAWLVAAVLVAISTLTSCGGSAAMPTPTPTPNTPTVAIVANPPIIAQGNSSMLTVTASNATQVMISDNIDSSTM